MFLTREFLEQEIQGLSAEAESHLAVVNQLIGAKIHCQKLLAMLDRPAIEPEADDSSKP